MERDRGVAGGPGPDAASLSAAATSTGNCSRRSSPRTRYARPGSTYEDFRVLADDRATPEALVAAIDRLEADRRYEADIPLWSLRHHDSPLVRGRILLARTRTWREPDLEFTQEMLETDPAWEARAAAAEAVAHMLQAWPGIRQFAREMLVEALLHEQDERVEQSHPARDPVDGRPCVPPSARSQHPPHTGRPATPMSRAARASLRTEAVVAGDLDAESGTARAKAIEDLLFNWHFTRYVEQVIRMLHDDREARCVGRLPGSSGCSSAGTRSRRRLHRRCASQPRAALLRAFLEDPEPAVQAEAYREIVAILTGAEAHLPFVFDREADTDWELLPPYLPPDEVRPPRPQPARVSRDNDVAVILNPEAPPEAVAAAIDRLEADRRHEAAWVVWGLHHHTSALVRGRALLAALRTWRFAEVDYAEEMLLEDEEWEAREAAAEAILYLLQAVPHRLEKLRQILDAALAHEQDERVETAIRQAIERLNDPRFPPSRT